MDDPYAPMRSLADGWRAQAHDLIERADQQAERARSIERARKRGRFDPDPEQLLQSARHNRTTAITLSAVAARLDASIDFATRHVLGMTS
jgi:hypothetical protein